MQVAEGATEQAAQIAGVLGLGCALNLVWLRDAHGRGGFYLPALVAVGQADMQNIATRVHAGYGLGLSWQAAWSATRTKPRAHELPRGSGQIFVCIAA